MLVVGVVAAQLRAAGGAEESLRQARKGLGKAAQNGGAAAAGIFQTLRAVQRGQLSVQFSGEQAGFQGGLLHGETSLMFLL